MLVRHVFSPDEALASKIEIVPEALVIPYNAPTKRGRSRLGGVLRSNFSFVENSKLFISESRQVNYPPQKNEYRDTELRQGTWLYGGKHDHRFGHFLVETLSRLWALDLVAEDIQGIVFIPEKVMPTARAQKRFAETAPLFELVENLPPREILTLHTRFERLVVPPQGCGASQMVPGCPEFRSFIKNRFARDVFPAGGKKLFISRTKMRGTPGHLLFENLIEESARIEGYEIYHPQEHDVRDQIAHYRAAEVILGVEGSAFHMVAYAARKHAKIGMIRRRIGDVPKAFLDQLSLFTGADCHDINAIQENFFVPGAMPVGNGIPKLNDLYKKLISLGFLGADHDIPSVASENVETEKERLALSIHKKI